MIERFIITWVIYLLKAKLSLKMYGIGGTLKQIQEEFKRLLKGEHKKNSNK